MPVTASQLITELTPLINSGKPVMLRHFTVGFGAGSYYDDNRTLSKSGNDVWVSGLHAPLNMRFGSQDSQFLMQGRVKIGDSKLYLLGNTETTDFMKLSIGSPPGSGTMYKCREEGVVSMPLDTPVYKLLYLTKIGGTGSLVGEG